MILPFAKFEGRIRAGFIVDQSIFLLIIWITSLRSVFLKCLKSNKEKSSVCNAFFFYETHLILGLPHFIRFSSLGFIVDQSIFLLRKMDAFFFFSLPQNFILDS